MKLIDVLASELNRWPDKRATAMQSGEDEEIYFDGGSPDDFYVDTRAEDGGLSGAVVTRQEWEQAVAARLATPTTPPLETMLTEWRDLEARAQAAQAEADALFEHAGQCHGEIVVRLAELGWGAPRGKPVVTLDDNDGWIEWKGGEVPVPEGTVVDLKTRDGDTVYESVVGESGNNTWYQFWSHDGDNREIMAYRITPSTQP